MASLHNPALEFPVLRLGLVGFAPAEQDLLGAAVKNLDSGMSWQVTRFSQADAWCANGSGLMVLPDGFVQIGTAASGVRPIRLDLNQSDRPIAFSLPLAAELPSAATFDLRSKASIRKVLARFEGWLGPMTVQMCLASHIAQENLDLSNGVYHVTVKGRLYAVVSRSGAGVLPIANPAELADATWARRPVFADEIPRHFLRIGFPQLMWQYAMRTTRDVLPVRFRTGLIYWRAPPQLPHRLLSDSHLLIARELAHAPATFRDLVQRTQLTDVQLARNLAALYVVGAITTNRRRASADIADPLPGSEKGAVTRIPQEDSVSPTEAIPGNELFADATAPAPFNPDGP